MVPLFGAAVVALHKKWSFPLRISSVTFTEEIPNGKFHFLCSVVISTDRLYTVKAEFRLLTGPNTAHGVLWFCDNEKFNIGLIWIWQKLSSIGVLINRCSENMQHIFRRTPMPKGDFNKVAKQLYWNHASACVLSCKFAAYFQNTFS